MPVTVVPRKRRLALTPSLIAIGQDLCGAPFMERTHALDVSAGGLSFESTHNVAVGILLALKILIPHRLRHRFSRRAIYSVHGRVTRVERLPAAGHYRVAMRFLGELEPAH
jgi:hypothetical protein